MEVTVNTARLSEIRPRGGRGEFERESGLTEVTDDTSADWKQNLK